MTSSTLSPSILNVVRVGIFYVLGMVAPAVFGVVLLIAEYSWTGPDEESIGAIRFFRQTVRLVDFQHTRHQQFF